MKHYKLIYLIVVLSVLPMMLQASKESFQESIESLKRAIENLSETLTREINKAINSPLSSSDSPISFEGKESKFIIEMQVYYITTSLDAIKNVIKLVKNTDYKKLRAREVKRFIEIIDENMGSLIGYNDLPSIDEQAKQIKDEYAISALVILKRDFNI